ncbi:MAG: hypothetical protein LC117_01275 [Bacteroidia bacterium]|nr:hypothetical protein [Bacteroidia bacterium]MCZ2276550.1 hypothetical protein [Bacteroidia bacterium]
MNITKETIADNTDIIRIELKPEDYTSLVNKEIKKTARTIQIKGFRQGHVPETIVRNRYGRAILTDEINKLVTDSLYKYFEDNKIEIFGQPLPVDSENATNNFEQPGDFKFAFEIGIRPDFTVNISPSKEVESYSIKVGSAEVEKAIEDMKMRHGEITHPQSIDNDCYIKARFTACSEDGVIPENAFTTSSWFKLTDLKDEKIIAEISLMKIADKKPLNLERATGSKTGISALLNIKAEEVEEHGQWYETEISMIEKTIPADLNQALFNKVYGKDVVTDVEALKKKVEEEIANEYKSESEHKLHHDIKDVLVEETGISLPEAFLKKWISASSEKPISTEEIDKNFKHYAYDMKWTLIRNKLVEEFKLDVKEEELLNYGRHYVMRMLSQYGISTFDPHRIDDMAARYIKDEKMRTEAANNILERKVFNNLSEQVKKKEKQVTLDEFIEIVKNHHH